MERNSELKWYLIHIYSGYEAEVEKNLRNMIENNNLQESITSIKVPVYEELVEKKGKKVLVEKKKFPGYVFIKMKYSSHVWFMVTNTRGVTGFVGPNGRPKPIEDEEVKKLGLEEVKLEDFNMKPGDSVKIITGPLEGFIGVVDSIIGERQKVKVIVSMFGRETPVELEFTEVDKI